MPLDPMQPVIKVGLVQIGELTWTRRQRQQWFMKNGIPVLKPSFTPCISGLFTLLGWFITGLYAKVQPPAGTL